VTTLCCVLLLNWVLQVTAFSSTSSARPAGWHQAQGPHPEDDKCHFCVPRPRHPCAGRHSTCSAPWGAGLGWWGSGRGNATLIKMITGETRAHGKALTNSLRALPPLSPPTPLPPSLSQFRPLLRLPSMVRPLLALRRAPFGGGGQTGRQVEHCSADPQCSADPSVLPPVLVLSLSLCSRG